MSYRFIHGVLAAMIMGYSVIAAATTQISTDRTILSIGAYGNGGYLVFSPAIPNLEGCPYTAGDTVFFDWTADPNAKAMYVTALSAYMAGHRVGFGVSGCYPGSAPLVYRIDVKP